MQNINHLDQKRQQNNLHKTGRIKCKNDRSAIDKTKDVQVLKYITDAHSKSIKVQSDRFVIIIKIVFAVFQLSDIFITVLRKNPRAVCFNTIPHKNHKLNKLNFSNLK